MRLRKELFSIPRERLLTLWPSSHLHDDHLTPGMLSPIGKPHG